MTKGTLIIIALIILVVLTGVQAVQMNSLKTNAGTGKVSVASSPLQSSQNSLPSNLQDLPSMVGGC